MKTSFSTVITLLLGVSMATAAFEPRATMAPHQKRDFSDGLDLSAILANPSSYLAKASSAFKNSKIASEFAKATAKPSFEKSFEKDLVSQFGSKTASIALQQYTAILGKLDATKSTKNDASSAASTETNSGGDDSGDGSDVSSAASVATVSVSTDSPTSTSTSGSQVLGISTSGASSPTGFTMTLVASAISVGAGVILAAL